MANGITKTCDPIAFVAAVRPLHALEAHTCVGLLTCFAPHQRASASGSRIGFVAVEVVIQYLLRYRRRRGGPLSTVVEED